MDAVQTTGNINTLRGLDATTSRTVTGSVSNGGISGSTVAEAGNIANSGKKELGQTEFLQLLMTSLQHQDPLNPTNNEDFIAQIAQFSTLENSLGMTKAMTALGTKLDDLVASQKNSTNSMAQVSAGALLGRAARIEAEVSSQGTQGATFEVHVDEGQTALAGIYGSDGTMIALLATDSEGRPLTAGDHEVHWDGATLDGNRAPSGDYEAEVNNQNGETAGYVFVEDRITGVSYGESGIMLEVDGRTLPFEKVLRLSEDDLAAADET